MPFYPILPFLMPNPDSDMTRNERTDESVNKNDERDVSMRPQRSSMTRQKAGQRGGLTTAKRHGKEFYEKIGRKGGQSRKKRDRDGVAV